MRVKGLFHAELERNWACAQSDYIGRVADIQEIPRNPVRIYEQFLLDFADQFPIATEWLLQRQAPKDLTIIGAGTQHTVVADKHEVIKINRRSVFLKDNEQQALAEESIKDHALLRNYVGSLVVGQTTTVDKNPLNLSKYAVQHMQANLAHQPLDLFPAYERTVDIEKLSNVSSNIPGIDEALRDLAIAGLKMYRERALVPDISGHDNIVLLENNGLELSCLDGLPVRFDTDPKGTERIASLLTDLQSKL